jgi:hypothetical protein
MAAFFGVMAIAIVILGRRTWFTSMPQTSADGRLVPPAVVPEAV